MHMPCAALPMLHYAVAYPPRYECVAWPEEALAPTPADELAATSAHGSASYEARRAASLDDDGSARLGLATTPATASASASAVGAPPAAGAAGIAAEAAGARFTFYLLYTPPATASTSGGGGAPAEPSRARDEAARLLERALVQRWEAYRAYRVWSTLRAGGAPPVGELSAFLASLPTQVQRHKLHRASPGPTLGG